MTYISGTKDAKLEELLGPEMRADMLRRIAGLLEANDVARGAAQEAVVRHKAAEKEARKAAHAVLIEFGIPEGRPNGYITTPECIEASSAVRAEQRIVKQARDWKHRLDIEHNDLLLFQRQAQRGLPQVIEAVAALSRSQINLNPQPVPTREERLQALALAGRQGGMR